MNTRRIDSEISRLNLVDRSRLCSFSIIWDTLIYSNLCVRRDIHRASPAYIYIQESLDLSEGYSSGKFGENANNSLFCLSKFWRTFCLFLIFSWYFACYAPKLLKFTPEYQNDMESIDLQILSSHITCRIRTWKTNRPSLRPTSHVSHVPL